MPTMIETLIVGVAVGFLIGCWLLAWSVVG
jgi:hypothetical protein